MDRKQLKERFPELKDPGDNEPTNCTPGSIEQELDMCEEGSLRGDEILHSHGLTEKPTAGPQSADQLLNRFEVDLGEENREGDEMSGDDHSSGLQGGEPELIQPHIDTGIPGDETRRADISKLGDNIISLKERVNRRKPGKKRAS